MLQSRIRELEVDKKVLREIIKEMVSDDVTISLKKERQGP